MKIEGSSSEDRRKRKRVEENVERIMRKRDRGRRARRRRVHAASTAIQSLFVACTAAFGSPATVPASPDVEMLRLLLDQMKLEDVGLSTESTDLLFFNARNHVAKGTPRITCTTMYNCDNFSMCLFFLPPKAVIPLHNHPGMTVFSKLLLGSMHIKSYDWVDPVEPDADSPSTQLRLATLVVDSDFKVPCNTSILFPTAGGNIHTFAAITPCVVLDVVGPPYSKKYGRDCAYYREHPYSYISNGATAECCFRWLEEIDVPKDLRMVRVEYLGPQIIDG